MEIDESLKVGKLLDVYGVLLTEKQKKIAEEYFYYDISLSEIAENNGISRQGVNDTIKKVTTILNNYENKLHIIKNKKLLKNNLIKATESLDVCNKIKEIIKNLEV